jgi:hypothetical protein
MRNPVATRNLMNEPFGEPRALPALTGFGLLGHLPLDLESLVSDTFHSKFNWLSSRGIFGSSAMAENS